jgi:hypothetical protein
VKNGDRRIFGAKVELQDAGQITNEELAICIPPNIIRVIKLRRMRRGDIGEGTDSYKIMHA